jgi:hypothetical protein
MREAIGEVLDRIEAAQLGDAHSFLRAVYGNPALLLGMRMRAAGPALPFERPKLSATAFIAAGGDFAERLERALERSNAARNGGTVVIDHSPPAPSAPDSF